MLIARLASACAIMRERMFSRLETIKPMNTALAMMPRPPTCIATMITPSPNSVQCVPVSSVTSPVTVIADVAM
ncbi:hypothetical protein GCM10029992_23710 [Glycomyces albus]